ncbi:MAG: hypothetical protein QOJ63_3372 [Solirubrobacteraceae bacterium]|jgi:hypothetical protein|nr:hypothetical protein [Solirubrobacteraceae bacterium]
MQVEFESGEFTAMADASSGGTVLALYGARTARVGPNPKAVQAQYDDDEQRRGSPGEAWDWRFQRGGSLIAVGLDRVEQSMALLGELLDRPSTEVVLLRAEMLLRARVALMDGDSSGSLTNAWTAMEGLLGDLLCRVLDNSQDRDVMDDSGAPAQFINSKRRKFFKSSAMTIRHVAELLSLLDVLPFHLYQATITCARARNDWLHTEKPPPAEIASLGIRTCGELFELLEEVPLQLQPAHPD